MINEPSVPTELARNIPLTASAAYLSFMSEFGAIIVTSLAIIFGIMQIVLRSLEHRAIMRQHRERERANESSK